MRTWVWPEGRGLAPDYQGPIGSLARERKVSVPCSQSDDILDRMLIKVVDTVAVLVSVTRPRIARFC